MKAIAEEALDMLGSNIAGMTSVGDRLMEVFENQV
jgi:hypothetical protein